MNQQQQPVLNRVEKHKGVTLVVRDHWATVVWDATGHSLEGPVDSEDAVRRVVRVAVRALEEIATVP
jgi:hypothetical protein